MFLCVCAQVFSAEPDSVLATEPAGHSIVKAMAFSAAVPGLGQVYNRQTLKAAGYVAGIIGLGYAAHIQNGRAMAAQIEEERTFYKNDRDQYIVYAVLVYLVNIIDAYVDAKLWDFDTGPDLSACTEQGVVYGVSLTWSW